LLFASYFLLLFAFSLFYGIFPRKNVLKRQPQLSNYDSYFGTIETRGLEDYVLLLAQCFALSKIVLEVITRIRLLNM
jgi:hypothetical protein